MRQLGVLGHELGMVSRLPGYSASGKPLFEMCCFYMGIAQIALDPLPHLSNKCGRKSAPNMETIYGNNVFQNGASLIVFNFHFLFSGSIPDHYSSIFSSAPNSTSTFSVPTLITSRITCIWHKIHTTFTVSKIFLWPGVVLVHIQLAHQAAGCAAGHCCFFLFDLTNWVTLVLKTC